MELEYTSDDLKNLSIRQELQFIQWLINLFEINDELNLKYDKFYQDLYYIKLYELLTKGFEYIESKKNNASIDFSKKDWYIILHTKILKLKNEISESELKYIQYKRHNSSHILQYDYEISINVKSGEIKKPNRNNSLPNLNEILDIHGSDYKIDQHITKKLHEKIVKIKNHSEHEIYRYNLLIQKGVFIP